jgi:hypothetical protein
MSNAFPQLSRGITPLPRRHSSSKELHFFDDEAMTDLGLTAYAKAFPECSSENAHLRAIDATPSYIRKVPDVPRRIRAMYHADVIPSLRFIAILRNPTQRFRSWFDHFGVRKAEELDMGINRFAALSLRKTIACARDNAIDVKNSEALFNSDCGSAHPAGAGLSSGLYAAQLQHYLQRFDSSQFAIISFGGFVRQPVDVLAGLGTFLGLQPNLVRLKASSRGSQRERHELNPRIRGMLDAFFEPSIPALSALLAEHLRRGMTILPRGIIDAHDHAANSSKSHMKLGSAVLADP